MQKSRLSGSSTYTNIFKWVQFYSLRSAERIGSSGNTSAARMQWRIYCSL